MRKLLFALLLVGFLPNGDGAELYRDKRQVYAFRSTHPCPATGKIHGACYGYVVDHIRPLACQGADRPWNMQWQTVADAKAKDRWELNCSLYK